MATVIKRKSGWLVQVRRKGHDRAYKTLPTKALALAWGREKEARIDQGTMPKGLGELRRVSLGDIIVRYVEDVTPRKRSAETERLGLLKLLKAPMCALSLADLSSSHLANYRDGRLVHVRAGTVRRELSLLHHILDVAQKEWAVPLAVNPVALVRLPALPNGRDRRLQRGDLARLKSALSQTRNPLIGPIMLIAIETGLRRGEIMGLTWDAIDLKARTAHIPQTKTGKPRTIPLTDAALAVLASIPRSSPLLFPMATNALKLAWGRLRVRAGLADLRFHDLRHEALSRFCELGLTIPELAVISGHKDPRMLFRYAHLRADDLARKLAGRTWTEHV